MGFLDDRCALPGKVAVLIGGADGLGRAAAQDLAAARVDLAVADRAADAIDGLEALLADQPGRLLTSCFDAREIDCHEEFFDAVDAELGRIDVLVNVVGGTFGSAFEDTNPKGWDALIRTNFTWLLSSIQQALPRLREAGGGGIVNLTLIEAHRAAPPPTTPCTRR